MTDFDGFHPPKLILEFAMSPTVHESAGTGTKVILVAIVSRASCNG